MKKSILIISQAVSLEYLQTIIDAFPNGVEADVITGSDLEYEKIIHSPKYAATSIKSRIISWMSHYQYVAKWAKTNKPKKYDYVFCTSNPPINAYIGLKLKHIFKCKFVFMDWDLYPQVIEQMMSGSLSRVVSRLWDRWNVKNLRKIDQIITIGDVVKQSIQERIPYDLKIKVIPIPVNTDSICPISKKENVFITENCLDGKFIVLYSGKLGRGHNIEIILEAARALEYVDDILFLFIGEGEKKGLVEKYIDCGHKNVKCFSLQPLSIFPYSIACGDIGIVSQDSLAAKYFMPSKTYSMMAAGEAIIGICSEYDDLQQLVEKNGIGFTVKDNDYKKLYGLIKYMYDHRTETRKMQIKSRKLAVEKYSHNTVASMYQAMFESL